MSPGPGEYDAKKMNTNKSVKIAGKHKAEKIEVIPGPGAYEQISKTPTATSYKMGKSARLTNTKDTNPGPGMYESQSSAQVSKFKSPQFKIG